MEREPIGVVGAGWVGLVTAACFAELGHEVWARDIVSEKVESLSRGEVPIHEPGLPELVAKNSERLHFTTDMGEVLAAAQLLFVCVDTPPTYSGDADLSRVEAVLAELGDSNEHALVMKSTVPVGTGRSIERRRNGIAYVSNPEFLKEGSAVDDFMAPDRVVVGANDGSEPYADRVEALYEPLGAEVVRTDVASKAEDLLAGARITESALEALDGADAAVLVTEWPEFAELDWAGEVKRRMRGPLVGDGRDFLDRDALVQAGFTYEGVGR